MSDMKDRAMSLWAGALLALPIVGFTATITGEVTIDGKPARGAMLTVFTTDKQVSESVFADASGRYRLDTQFQGEVTLRARAPLATDAVAKLELSRPEATLNQAFTLKRLTTPQEISDALPASAHFTRIKFPTLAQRQQFQTDCTPCHQIGDAQTRRVRSLAEWKAILPSMLAYADYTTNFLVDDYAAALVSAFDGRPMPARENTIVDAQALSARIVEWKLPESKFPHDSDFYPRNGKFYTVDMFEDRIWETDPKTNKTTIWPIPALGVPIGGAFAGKDGVPTWVPRIRHGNHSLQVSPQDGMFYITGSVGGEIAVFDPVTRSYTVHKIGGNALWPHSLRFDSKGIVWFTVNLTNQIGRFDPKTGKSTLIELPNVTARKDDPNDRRIPAPYGIDINPVDDSVWYTKVWANQIGRVDPKTLQVQEWEPPVKAPKRARFDSTGGFWIPGFGDGTVARLDTRTMKYEIFKIPTLSEDEVEAPYALAVDNKTQDVWVSANMSDRFFRFVPGTKKWTAFPLPTKGAYFREITMTPDGWVCAPSSPEPPVANGDDGSPLSLMCVLPEGNKSGVRKASLNGGGAGVSGGA
jgi:virginiamycin B lyase